MLLQTLLVTVQAMNNVKMFLLALHLPKYRTEAITHILQIVTYPVGQKGMEYRVEQR